MQMYGTDLNPVAWFVVKAALAQVEKEEVEELLADVEAQVKPQIMPFYACHCPRGHTGKWTRLSTGELMDSGFKPLSLSRRIGPTTTMKAQRSSMNSGQNTARATLTDVNTAPPLWRPQ